MPTRTKFLQILLLAFTFVVLAALTWRKTADILVDFGLQLYIPWQLTTGKVLYRDIAYLPGGPFSQYFNASLFKFFGVSITTILVANLAITILLVAMIFRFFEKLSESRTATIVCFSILSLLAFSELCLGGNYNYVSPYSHEAFHGMVLSVGAVFLFSRWIVEKKRLFLLLAGISTGLVFMTKPEIFLALFATSIFALAIHVFQNRGVSSHLATIAIFLVGSAVPVAVAFVYFQRFHGAGDAFQCVAWAWVPLLTTDAANNKFYRWCLGLEFPLGYSFKTLCHFIALAGFLGLGAWCNRPGIVVGRQKIMRGVILAVMAGVSLFLDWAEAGSVFLLLIPAISLFLIWRWWKSRDTSDYLIPAILWSVFATVLLAKMGFNSRIWHYGVYLGMPALAISVWFVFGFLPGFFTKWNVRPKAFLLTLTFPLVVAVIQLSYLSYKNYSLKTFTVGDGPDRLTVYDPKLDRISDGMKTALEWVEKNTHKKTTLAVLPEGVMLNYLSRRQNPTPYTTFIFPEWQTFGEEKILAAYNSHPPDFIILLDRGTIEYGGFNYGVGFFGENPIYGAKTMQWIRENYSHVHLIGKQPLARKGFGMEILRLNPASKDVAPDTSFRPGLSDDRVSQRERQPIDQQGSAF